MNREILHFQLKKYTDLSRDALYDLLQLRSEVFVVEQDCVYQDIDGKDQKAFHVLGYKGQQLIAYTRIFPPGAYFTEASIGRVIVKETERKHQYGYDLMRFSIEKVLEKYAVAIIKISAQTYLKRFYNNLGFKEVGTEYLEDGIPHVGMVWQKEEN